ncbi:putative alcohol dehydrogenase [Trichocladium antarcticum]|uniref:Alcohol dehydrogenase n=1 Tax=Trichocladium antarcticum TaxID=1450529 RepID=A0AAN6UMD5_9PEZI|nr:putative alcohol dehydrogenase [Trichocladium antarcticum]
MPTTTTTTTTLAAVSPAQGQPFTVQPRATPAPGPGEVLLAVKSVALNPADGHMRNTGLFIPAYPTVIGFDMAGLVLAAGADVPAEFAPGTTRVAAYAAAAWRGCAPDYGAFQARCLVPWQHCVVLPQGDGMSWNQAATLPVAAQVMLSAWDVLGVPRMGAAERRGARDGGGGKEALLVWGASSSVGTMGVQGGRLLREEAGSGFAAVYATAGPANHAYVRGLGADRVFDYRDPGVVQAIVAAAREDGLVIRRCFLATGQLSQCQAVLGAFVGEDGVAEAKIASAPIVPADAGALQGVETVFLMPSTSEAERLEQFRYWLGTWLKEKLAAGVIRPSPEPRVVGKDLGAINAAVDMVFQGVSCAKLVVEVEE